MVSSSPSVGLTTWEFDPAHTRVEFSVKHMMFATVKGSFADVHGTLRLDEADPSRSSVEADIDAASLHTGDGRRDAHLKSADFLDVEKYPTITFKSTRVEVLGSDHARVVGDLTIHGVTREVELDTELTGHGTTPFGTHVAGFEAKTTINRKDFGLNWNVSLEAGGVLVGDTIKIEIYAEAVEATESTGAG